MFKNLEIQSTILIEHLKFPKVALLKGRFYFFPLNFHSFMKSVLKPKRDKEDENIGKSNVLNQS